MTRDQALKKVLKCLRLSKSANEHEAAAALRQARKLMDEYGIHADDAIAQEYTRADSKPAARGQQVPPSLGMLAYLVADGFRCEVVWVVDHAKHWGVPSSLRVAFCGRGADPTVAAYAFDVLRRQLDRDRRAHLTRVRKRANREARGEAFAQGWIRAVEALFPAAELSDDESQALAACKRALFPNTTEGTTREMGRGGRRTADDWVAGHSAGSKARLHSGVAGEGQRRIGHG